MALSNSQREMHFGLFSQILENHLAGPKTTKEKDAYRRSLYRDLKLPDSFSKFTKRDFDKFITGTAHLRNEVDIKDRDREPVIHTITRLGIGIAELTGQAPGEYARRIMIDWSDTSDLEKLAVAQAAALEDKGHRDLTNLAMTLKNRLSKMITKIKESDTARPDLLRKWRKKEAPLPDATGRTSPWISNNEIIDKLIAGKALCEIEDDEPQPLPLRPPVAASKRGYNLATKKKNFQPRPQLQPATTAHHEDDNLPF